MFIRMCFAQAWISLRMLALLTLLTGVAYPALVTGLSLGFFPGPAGGSLIERDGKVVGSEWIGQEFVDAGYFWGRPSGTGPRAYEASASSGTNLGPLNPALADAVKGRVERLRAADPTLTGPIPVDLVTASASGLDPHVSPAGAAVQIARVAQARGLAAEEVRSLVRGQIEGRDFGFLGEPRVNVLRLNLALDDLSRRAGKPYNPK